MTQMAFTTKKSRTSSTIGIQDQEPVTYDYDVATKQVFMRKLGIMEDKHQKGEDTRCDLATNNLPDPPHAKHSQPNVITDDDVGKVACEEIVAEHEEEVVATDEDQVEEVVAEDHLARESARVDTKREVSSIPILLFL